MIQRLADGAVFGHRQCMGGLSSLWPHQSFYVKQVGGSGGGGEVLVHMLTDVVGSVMRFGIVGELTNVLRLASVWKLSDKDKSQYEPGTIHDAMSWETLHWTDLVTVTGLFNIKRCYDSTQTAYSNGRLYMTRYSGYTNISNSSSSACVVYSYPFTDPTAGRPSPRQEQEVGEFEGMKDFYNDHFFTGTTTSGLTYLVGIGQHNGTTEEYKIYTVTQDTTTTAGTIGTTMKLSTLATIWILNLGYSKKHPDAAIETAHQNFIALNSYHLPDPPTPQPPTAANIVTVIGLTTAGINGFASPPTNNPLNPLNSDMASMSFLDNTSPVPRGFTKITLSEIFSLPHKSSFIGLEEFLVRRTSRTTWNTAFRNVGVTALGVIVGLLLCYYGCRRSRLGRLELRWRQRERREVPVVAVQN